VYFGFGYQFKTPKGGLPMLYAGLDYHQSRSSICLLDQGGNKVLTREVKGHWIKVVEEFRKIKDSRQDSIQVCFEASCGGGHLYDQLRQVADRVVVANPSQLRMIFRNKRKNDRTDAFKLAQVLMLDAVPTVYMPSLSVREWRSLIVYRSHLVEKRTRVKNEIRSLLRNSGVVAPAGLWTRKGVLWLEREAQLSEGARLQMNLCLYELENLRNQLSLAEKDLNKRAKKHPGVKILQTIPGIGVRTAEALVAYIDSPDRFGRKKIGAYLGLIPCQDQSGDHNRLGHITKQGPPAVRRLLVEASWLAVRKSKTVKAYFDRIVGDDPDRRKIAIVAVAHYLARVSLALLRNQECWMEREEREAA
jgi:transposase